MTEELTETQEHQPEAEPTQPAAPQPERKKRVYRPNNTRRRYLRKLMKRGAMVVSWEDRLLGSKYI